MKVRFWSDRAFASLRTATFVFGVSIVTIFASVGTFAATVLVDDDGFGVPGNCDDPTAAFASISSAVSAASPGDTIEVCSGTYAIASTVSLNKSGMTLIGVGPTKPVVQVPTSTGYAFIVGASNVTLDNLEIEKTDLGSPHNMILVNAASFTAQNNLIYGPDPGSPWSVNGFVSRAFEVSGSSSGLLLTNNVIHTVRQPAYISGPTVGTISNNNVSGTRGWVIDGATITFTNNTFGPPSNQGADIALLAACNPADYPNLPALSAGNDNAVISAQFGGGVSGASAVWVDDSAAPGGLGTIDSPLQTIQAGIDLVYPGGTVNVLAGTYLEDVTVNKAGVKLSGAGPGSSIISGPIGGGGSTITVSANNVEISGFLVTREGNNPTDWNGALNSIGIAIPGGVSGTLIHDNRIAANRNGIDINNSSGNTVRNNVITNNRTGVILRNQTNGTTFVENEITDNWTLGILFLDASGGTNSPLQSALSSAFSNNDISGNWYGQVVDRQTGGSLPAPGANLKNFRGNWFGTATPVFSNANSSEPGYSSLIPVEFGGSSVPPGGQPEILGTASANIMVAPLLTSGVDTDVETTPGRGVYGFQGLTPPITPSALGGWFFFNEGANGSGTFVSGPATAPLGIGSARLTVDATGRESLGTQAYSGTRLADITTLSYSSYQNGNTDPFVAASLQFDVDSDLSDANTAYQGRLVFEPYQNGTVQQNIWQSWNTLNGVWWGSAGSGTRPVTVACPQSSPCTTAQLLNLFPNVGVRFIGPGDPANGVLLFRAGGPWAGGFVGSVDAFTIGISGGVTTYDFEPETPTVTINQAIAPQTDPTSTSPVNFTVTFSEAMTGFDGSDVQLTGTAGATTAVVSGGPTVFNVAVSGMTTSGTVIASIPAGAANASGSGAGNAASTSTDNSVTYLTCANVSIPSGMTTLRNTSVAVPVNVDDLTGKGVISFDFTLTYDPAVINTPTVDQTGTLSSGMTITTNSLTPGTLIVSGFGVTPLAGAGTLIKFNFNAIGAIGTSTALSLPSFMFNEGIPCVGTTNGSLSIISGTIAGNINYANAAGPPSGPPLPVNVPNVTLNAPGTPNVSGSTDSNGNYSLSGFGPGAYTVTPSKTGNVNGISAFDSGLIAQYVVNLIPLTANQQIAADVSQNNTITSFDAALIAQWVVLIPNPGVTGTWKFTPTNRAYPNVEASYAADNYSAILMGEVSGNWNPAAPDQFVATPESSTETKTPEGVAIGVTAPTINTSTGANFDVPLAVQDTTGQGIISYQFDLTYDPAVITPQGSPCDVTSTISSGLTPVCNPISPGLIKVAVFGAIPITGAGTLMKLKFTAVGENNDSSTLTLVNFQFNEGVPQDTTTNGLVTLFGPTAAGVSLTGRLVDSIGTPVARARINFVDTSGRVLSTTTNQLGKFRIGLVAGETYTVSVRSKGYRFTERVISLQEDVIDFLMIAEP